MDPLVIVGVGTVLAAALGSWWFASDRRARRAIRGAPRKRIEDVVDGERVRIVGRVEAKETIVAPFSGRACVCWRAIVHDQTRDSDLTIIDEQAGIDFVLRDGDAKALIEPEKGWAVLNLDCETSCSAFRAAPQELEAFLRERGHSSKGIILTRSMHFQEGVIEPGELVSVIGIGRWRRDPDEEARPSGYREVEFPRRLVMKNVARVRLLLTDEPDLLR